MLYAISYHVRVINLNVVRPLTSCYCVRPTIHLKNPQEAAKAHWWLIADGRLGIGGNAHSLSPPPPRILDSTTDAPRRGRQFAFRSRSSSSSTHPPSLNIDVYPQIIYLKHDSKQLYKDTPTYACIYTHRPPGMYRSRHPCI